MRNDKIHVAVIGAGPAGLTAAYKLTQRHINTVVFEKSCMPGGISRTERYLGYRFDVGGHRFFTKLSEINELWEQVIGDQFLEVSRLSRIYYDGKFYDYPLKISNVLSNLGLSQSILVIASYLKSRLAPHRKDNTLDQWVINRFGKTLFNKFFKSYTEKVWGIPCDQLHADWAAQRIKNLSVWSAVTNALFGGNNIKSLIRQFHYPRLGPGQMWQRFAELVEQENGSVQFNTDVKEIRRKQNTVQSITIKTQTGESEISAKHFISSMPVTELIYRLTPSPPPEILRAADGLKYRNMILVGLIINQENLFPDNWIYIHSPNVKVGRIQNFKNWSQDMVPDSSKTSLGMEYFCSPGDDLWEADDIDLIELAKREIHQLSLANAADVIDACVIRQSAAYPIYDSQYHKHLKIIQEYLTSFTNLQTIGRNGLHRYNNQDHSMMSGILAANNILGDNHDLWQININQSYLEQYNCPQKQTN